MQSPAAVTPIDRLTAILRLDMPPARSLSTSRILRMGNLCPGMSSSLPKGTEAMPIRRSPNGAGYTRPQPGRDRPEWVVAINRNAWFAINWNWWTGAGLLGAPHRGLAAPPSFRRPPCGRTSPCDSTSTDPRPVPNRLDGINRPVCCTAAPTLSVPETAHFNRIDDIGRRPLSSERCRRIGAN